MTSIEDLPGGWNSTTWLVHLAGPVHNPGRYVAKLADSGDADAFRGGLRAAVAASSRGFPSGPPVSARDGSLAVDLPEGVLALLEYVPGRPPDTASPADARRVGETLARAHRALGDEDAGLCEQFAWPWTWADACLRDIPMTAKIRDAAARALDDARGISMRRQLRIGVVHGDPGLGGFRLEDGRIPLDGLIDWSAAMQAPRLYDLGSLAVITRHHPRVLDWALDGYKRVSPEACEELAHLDAFVKLRWMCNAIYFAARLDRGIVRGARSAADNEEGLAEAYAGLTAEAPRPQATR
ncbi:phosphotransferase enzyme family protein [Streptomyces sp. TS71-3]|uniref:phosphotransferase enzyme family protein n=1 Tax=Streptomyces sp. TS71-3 TaxID=2733862 RepID=UPI001BB4093A|nr:phosphotransferase [Streptomyces sp. TS71-3]